MGERVRSWLLRLLRVPPEPEVPRDGGPVRVFRAAPNYFRYRIVLWLAQQIGAAAGLVGGLVALYAIQRWVANPTAVLLLRGAEVFAWSAFALQLPFSLALVRLDFELRWYILSDRSLRIREGILSVREKTMTFANVQQISTRQNPLQRLLGIADVEVRTAGGGSGGGGKGEGQAGESMHEAYFRGVDNAEEIRTAIRQRVRLHRDAGLGDPDEAPPLVPVSEPGVLLAARELRDEIRALRAARTVA
jgi:uncharacterized membrane protein YdbT with pleckstrin-like domain